MCSSPVGIIKSNINLVITSSKEDIFQIRKDDGVFFGAVGLNGQPTERSPMFSSGAHAVSQEGEGLPKTTSHVHVQGKQKVI